MERRNPFRSLILCLTVVMLWAPRPGFAQDLDDTLDAELDDMMTDAPDLQADDVSDEDDLAAELGDEPPPVKSSQAAPAPTPAPAKDDLELEPAVEELAVEEPATSEPAPTQATPSPQKVAPAAPKAAPVPEPAPEEPAIVAEPELESQPEIEPEPVQRVAPAEPPPPSYDDGDQPNLALERRLHRIFQSAGAPVPEDDWAKMVKSLRQDFYAVQAGDTLWDISQTFFGDGFFWSKLWAENRSIENPHQISPGKAVRFVPGTEAEAPTMAVTEASLIPKISGDSMALASLSELDHPAPVYKEQASKLVTAEDIAKGDVDESELLPSPEIPEAAPSLPPLLRLPPSFVSSRVEGARNEFDSTGLDIGRRRAITDPPIVVANSFIADEEPAYIGSIEEVELGDKVAGTGQAVFLKIPRGAKVGDKFSVIYTKGKINANRLLDVGPVVEVGGIVEVIEAVNEGKGYYKAMVTQTINPIRVGAVLLDETLPRISFDMKGRRNSTEARVIGGEFDDKRLLLGQSSVIYLDAGTDAGINQGDVLAVQTRRKERNAKTKVPDWSKPIGVVKVVKAYRTVSTAIVIKSTEEIVRGDRTGAEFPKPLPNVRTEALDSVIDKASSSGDTEEIEF